MTYLEHMMKKLEEEEKATVKRGGHPTQRLLQAKRWATGPVTTALEKVEQYKLPG